MDDFHYARRHLTKLPHADEDGCHELRYQDEEADLLDAIEKTLRTIRERDGVKYFSEVAGNLIEAIAYNVSYHAGPLRPNKIFDGGDTHRPIGEIK